MSTLPIPPIIPPQVPPHAAPDSNVPVSSDHRRPTTDDRRTLPWGKIAIASGIIILILIGWLSLGKVEINATPGPDKVYINGKEAKIGAQKHMPGQLRVKIAKDGYLTYEKTYKLGFHGNLISAPTLKKLPVAELMTEGVAGGLTLANKGVGTQGISADRNYIVRATLKKTPAVGDQPSVIGDRSDSLTTETQSSAFNVEKLNLDPLTAIDNVQYPSDKRYALITGQAGEIGLLDFARRDVTSQDYSVFDSNIKSAAPSPDGINIFYWLFQNDLQKNFLVRDTLQRNQPDRFFDQPLIDQLGVTKLKFRWSPDGQKVLGLGEKTILIDILGRKASILEDKATLENAWFSNDGLTVIGLTAESVLTTINLTTRQLMTHDITTSADKLTIADNNLLYIVAKSGEFFSYNFDTKLKVVYLIDASIIPSDITSWLVDPTGALVYFVVDNKLYTATLVRGDYNE